MAGCSEDQVEEVVRKAVAEKLIIAEMDQVERVVTIKWIRPRVLTSLEVSQRFLSSDLLL